MLSRRDALLLGSAALAAGPGLARAGGDKKPAPLRRGIGMHDLLNWAKPDPADRQRYQWPPFTGGRFEVDPRLFGALRAAGFDFVRLTLDPGPFVQATPDQRDSIIATVVAKVKRILALDLGVLLNVHPNTQMGGDFPKRFIAEDGPVAQGYADTLARLAPALAPFSDQRFAFEPSNEPDAGYDRDSARAFATLQGRWHDIIRAKAPDLPLVLTGGRGGNATGLTEVDPARYRDSRVQWTFHYYWPHIFTHQGVTATEGTSRVWRYLPGLPYPANPALEETTWAQVRARIDLASDLDDVRRLDARLTARREIAAYLRSGFGPAQIATDLLTVAQWATRNGVDPRNVLLGEFGTTRGADGAADVDRSAWLADVRMTAERLGFSWSLWVATGSGGMAILDESTFRVDPVTLRALGLAAS